MPRKDKNKTNEPEKQNIFPSVEFKIQEGVNLDELFTDEDDEDEVLDTDETLKSSRTRNSQPRPVKNEEIPKAPALDEDGEELDERDRQLYDMELARIKAMNAKKEAPKNEVAQNGVTFEIKKNVSLDELFTDDYDDDELEEAQETERSNKTKEANNATELDEEVGSINEIGEDEEPARNEEADYERVNGTMFANKLNNFNDMYKTNVDANEFISSLTNAWSLLISDDENKKLEGKNALSQMFSETIKQAFDIEKDVAYEEQRIPDYVDIIKSANELMRVSMFTFADLYHNEKRAELFEPTAFGAMTADEMADLCVGDGIWELDQKSDEAWEIQSKEARKIADEWLKEDKPYQKMIDQMKDLVESRENKEIETKEIYDKLAAAEWLLLNNDKMMVDDPEDPLNKMPNWGNRYWKAIVEAREALGVPKHISMRELIQGNYAEMKKTVSNVNYNKKQIEEQLFDPEQRAIHDSMERQKLEFAIQREGIATSQIGNEQRIQEEEMTSQRMKITVEECDERRLMKDAPKSMAVAPQKAAETELRSSRSN